MRKLLKQVKPNEMAQILATLYFVHNALWQNAFGISFSIIILKLNGTTKRQKKWNQHARTDDGRIAAAAAVLLMMMMIIAAAVVNDG